MAVFDAEDFVTEVPDDEGTEGTPKKPEPPKWNDVKVPDDYEDESLRGLTPVQLAQQLRESRAREAQALQIANRPAPTPAPAPAPAPRTDPKEYEITDEDLLGGKAETFNQKMEKRLEQLLETKATPLLLEQYHNNSQMAYSLVKNDKANVPYWDDYEAEILAVANKTHVSQTAKPATWYGIYNHVTSLHKNEIIAKEVKKALEYERTKNTPLPHSERGRGGAGVTPTTLSDEQRHVARGLGLTDEQYIEGIKLMEA